MKGAGPEGKVAVVTGGGSGIGRALCGELARRRARVVAADIDTAGAEETAAGIRAGTAGPAAGPRALARRVDVTDSGDVEALIVETVRDFGRIDFLFNNAGVSANGEFQDIGPEHWKRNKTIVITPASQAIYWLLYRLAPALLPWAGSKIVETMRRNAEADGR